MPVNIHQSLPAIEELRRENIQATRAALTSPLRIAIVNLMPVKTMTETDLLRLISNSPLPVEIDLVTPATHQSKNTPPEHIKAFYTTFDSIRHRHYDGLIVTGAPVEKIPFEQVDYWPELTRIFDWARTSVNSTLYICWAGLAGLYYHYGVTKHVIDRKISGVFPHTVTDPLHPIFRGFDDVFFVPHSRFSEVRRSDIEKVPELTILSESPDSGIYMVGAGQGREFFITGHSEYSPLTLDFEYRRDCAKGMNPAIPANYYPADDPSRPPIVRWRAHANLLFSNWIHYFVAQQSAR